MRLSRSLGLAAAAAAGLGFASGAYATGTPKPDTTLSFSAQSIALTPGTGVNFFGSNLAYATTLGTTITAGAGSVIFSTTTGDTFTVVSPGVAAGNTACVWIPGAVLTTPAVSANTVTCPVPAAAGPYTSVSLIKQAAATTGEIGLTGADVSQLGLNTYPFLSPFSSGNARSGLVQISAAAVGTNTNDASPIPIVGLAATNSLTLGTAPVVLNIDLGGAGLPAIAPGAGFLQPLANGTRAVTTAGYLGSLTVNVSQGDLDARTGLFGIGGPSLTGNTNSAPAITATVTPTLGGDFATLTSAYLVPHNNGTPDQNAANCTPVAPANALVGTIDTAKRNISFATFGTTQASFGAEAPVFGVCLVTNGTQVIQESPTANGLILTPAPNTIQLTISAAITGITNPYLLTPAPSLAFGSIQYQGSVFFAQNVFGAQNLYPTFFRVVNSSNASVKVWAVLTKDVNNVVPETGNGSCADPGGITATCNTAFVANLTALTDPTGLSKGAIQANTAVYYTADQIAALAGTSLPPSSLHATVYLMSPSSGVRFSAVSQNPVNLDLISVP
jgi:hypothetical protein